MAKKKVDSEKEFDEKLARIKFDTKNIGDVYEAQVCLALKLDTLIELFQKVIDHIEKKQSGKLGI